MKSLIAYYSRRGNNYVNGSIEYLSVGNTEIAANMIRELTGSDIFRIDTVKVYPEDYMATTEVAKQELREEARPELTAAMDNMDDYQVIFLGYPCWWGTMPMAVLTFLESCDFAGKTIVPFCTHEGSGMGSSERDLKKAVPGAKVLKGLAIRGGGVKEAGNAISAWLRELGLIA